MAFCSGCGSQVSEGTSFCPKCGRAVAGGAGAGAAAAPAPAASQPIYAAPPPVYAAPPTATANAGLSDNAAGAIAYLTFIPALIFLLIEPYNKKPFVRFHAFQCIGLSVVSIALSVGLGFLSFGGWFLGFGLFMLIRLVLFVAWLICIINAAQGKMFELPLIGPFAKQQAGQ